MIGVFKKIWDLAGTEQKNIRNSILLGFFNQNSLGQLTAVATTTLSDVENAAPVVIVTSLGGFLKSLVFSLAIFLFDWRIGLIVAAGVILFLYVVSLMEKRSRADIPKRQAAQATLVEKVLETIQGMSVVKAFDLDDAKGKKVDQAIDESCEKNSVLEQAVNPYVAAQQIILNLCSVAILFASVSFYLNGTLSLGCERRARVHRRTQRQRLHARQPDDEHQHGVPERVHIQRHH